MLHRGRKELRRSSPARHWLLRDAVCGKTQLCAARNVFFGFGFPCGAVRRAEPTVLGIQNLFPRFSVPFAVQAVQRGAACGK